MLLASVSFLFNSHFLIFVNALKKITQVSKLSIVCIAILHSCALAPGLWEVHAKFLSTLHWEWMRSVKEARTCGYLRIHEMQLYESFDTTEAYKRGLPTYIPAAESLVRNQQFTVSQIIHHKLWTSNFYYRLHKVLSLICILSKMNPFLCF